MRVDKIDSSTGNIRVEVPDGNLVDANNISVPDTENLSELEAQWTGMLATQSTAQISVDDTINAYENEIDQEYQTYWMFRDEQPNPSVFDPTFQVTLPAGQLAAWTTYYTSQGTSQGLSGTALSTFVNNALTTLANADTQEYRSYNAIFGKLGNSYNPNYMYFANQTPLGGSVSLTFGPADIDSTGYLIDLPGNGYVTGQALVYHANGGIGRRAHRLAARTTRSSTLPIQTRSASPRATRMRPTRTRSSFRTSPAPAIPSRIFSPAPTRSSDRGTFSSMN